MTINNIREKLHTYIDTADAKKIKGLYMLMEEEVIISGTVQIDNTQKKILDERMKQHSNGKDKSYSWKEVHDSIRRKRKTAE